MIWTFNDLWVTIQKWISDLFSPFNTKQDTTNDAINETKKEATTGKDNASNADTHAIGATKKATDAEVQGILAWAQSFINTGKTDSANTKLDGFPPKLDDVKAVCVSTEGYGKDTLKKSDIIDENVKLTNDSAINAGDKAQAAGDFALIEGEAGKKQTTDSEGNIKQHIKETVADPLISFEDLTGTTLGGLPDSLNTKVGDGYAAAGTTIGNALAAIPELQKKANFETEAQRRLDIEEGTGNFVAGATPDKPPEWKGVAPIMKEYVDKLLVDVKDSITRSILDNVDGTPEGANKAADAYYLAVTKHGLTTLGLSIAAESLSVGAIKSFSQILTILENGLGLRRLSRIIFAPPIEEGISKPLSQYYRAKYQVTELTKPEIDELYRRGWKDSVHFFNDLQSLGYNLNRQYYEELLVWKIPSTSDSISFYKEGFIDRATLLRLLLANGIKGSYAEALMREIDLKPVSDSKDLTLAQLQSAFSEGIISENDFRAKLQLLGYSLEAITVMVELQKSKNEITLKTLSKAELTKAFDEGVINAIEFRKSLLDLGYDSSSADVIVQIESLKRSPSGKNLTRADYAKAFRSGVLSITGYKTALVSLGYSDSDADLIIAVDNITSAPKERALSKADFDFAYQKGIIGDDAYRQGLLSLGYNADDIELLIILSQTKATTTVKTLSQAQVTTAWSKGIIDINECGDRLSAMGYSNDDISILLGLASPAAVTA